MRLSLTMRIMYESGAGTFGFSRDLPVGLQIAGPHFGEAKLLNVAHAYQKETDWHRRIPAAFAKEVL